MAENEELRRKKQELFSSQTNLSQKLSILSSEEDTLFSGRDEIQTQLKEMQDKYDLEKMTMEEQIKLIKEQIAISSAGSEDQQTHLKSKIAEVAQDRDRLLEELRQLKAGMQKENEEIAEKNKNLKKKLEQEKKEKEQLEQHLSKIQEEQGQAIIELHKKLGKHVKDMNTWKDFLEQDKEYDSIDLHINMANVIKDDEFQQKVAIIEGAFGEETATLQKLLKERNAEAKHSPHHDAKSSDDGQKSSARKKKTTHGK